MSKRGERRKCDLDMGEKQSKEIISEESLMLDLANKAFKADTKLC